ncbi:MAG: ankyrin repeat domain-containing protein [Candidatus Anstonellales archaeon]
MGVEKKKDEEKEEGGSIKKVCMVFKRILKEDRVINYERLIQRFLKALNRGKGDKVFEELKSLNERNKEKGKMLGKELLEECKKEEMDFEKFLRLILEGADINVEDEEGKSALMHVAEHGYIEVVKLLIKLGVQVDLQDKYGQTALMHAAWNGNRETVSVLLNAGADPFIINNQWRRAYKFANDGYVKKI